MRRTLAFYIALFFIALAWSANMNSKVRADNESLGGRLLEDLPMDSQRAAASPQQSSDRAHVKALESALKAFTPMTGFGAGSNPRTEPLARIQKQMQYAQTLLPEINTGDKAAKVQQQVISGLDKLIAELSKQCQGGQCQGGQCQNGNQPKPGQNPKPNSSNSSAMASGRSAARDSTDRLDRTTAKPVEKAAVDEMVKAAWGQLPERTRQQMLQSFPDEFLPKYEAEIEQYYRRLSEEQATQPSSR
jgi:hypothetical protein